MCVFGFLIFKKFWLLGVLGTPEYRTSKLRAYYNRWGVTKVLQKTAFFKKI